MKFQKSPLKSLEKPSQIVIMLAFFHEFTMQPAGFGNGLE